MAWQKNGTPDTLGVAGDAMTITDLTALTFNQFLIHSLSSGTISEDMRFNNDTVGNYALRDSRDGQTDDVLINQTSIVSGGDSADVFIYYYCINISAEEKLVIGNKVTAGAVGAGTAPNRREQYGKWTNTSSQITEIDIFNISAGSYDTNSNLSALGTD